jgi:PAS domain S-box-containing protein
MEVIRAAAADENERLRGELAAARQQAAELEFVAGRYRNIFENAVEGIFQITPDGRFLLANPALAQMLGYPSPNALLQSVTNVRGQLYVHADDFTRLNDLLAQADVVRNFDCQFYRADGRIIWFCFNLHVVRDSSGSLSYYEGTAQDITQRKEIEEQLRRRESQLSEVQGMVHLGSWEWNIGRNTVTWSKELYRIYGLDQNSFQATFEGYLERVHPDDRERVQHLIGQAVQTAEPFSALYGPTAQSGCWNRWAKL